MLVQSQAWTGLLIGEGIRHRIRKATAFSVIPACSVLTIFGGMWPTFCPVSTLFGSFAELKERTSIRLSCPAERL